MFPLPPNYRVLKTGSKIAYLDQHGFSVFKVNEDSREARIHCWEYYIWGCFAFPKVNRG